jgi:hypothetical protein
MLGKHHGRLELADQRDEIGRGETVVTHLDPNIGPGLLFCLPSQYATICRSEPTLASKLLA